MFNSVVVIAVPIGRGLVCLLLLLVMVVAAVCVVDLLTGCSMCLLFRFGLVVLWFGLVFGCLRVLCLYSLLRLGLRLT